MALTTTYSISPLLTRTLPTQDIASNSDTVGLSGGGWATVAEDSSGITEATIYDASGNVAGSLAASVTDSKIAQLTNGDVIIAGNDPNLGIMVMSSGGLSTNITPSGAETNADIAALSGGGFVVVDQNDFGGATHDHDIYIRICNSAGDVLNTVSPDTTDADDENACVAGLSDGGFAVAWERIDASGKSTAWYAVYNSDGSVRTAPTLLDGLGPVNHQMSIAAGSSGSFTISYENNDNVGEPTNVGMYFFGPGGSFFFAQGDSGPDDSETALTTLSNGLVLSTFTHLFDLEHGDFDILGTLFDPATGAALTGTSTPLAIDASADSDSESSVSAIGLAQFVVSYSSITFGEIHQKTFQLVRTVIGDSADDTFTGDDAIDIVNGLGGNDTLAGGANDDTLNGGDGNDYLDGGAGKDILNGGANIDFLIGGDGNDTLNGGRGPDAMRGGLGNDVFYVDNAGDEVSDAVGGGNDKVFSTVSYSLQAGQEIETLATTSNAGIGAINLTGNAFGQQLIGNAGNNVLRGGGGNDNLIGGSGIDKLIGGTGLDQLNGGAGNDFFIYTALNESGTTATTRDQITGFATGDKIDVHLIDAHPGGVNHAFVLDTNGDFAEGEIRQTVTANGHLLIEFNADADAAPDMSILLRDHTTFLGSGEFVL